MLDVHIAKSFDDAMQNEPIARIDFDVHLAFFNDQIGFVASCPQLQRMSDHYSDCSFAGQQILALLAEIDTVSSKITATSPHGEWLKKFRNACNSAIGNGDSLFVICD